MYGNDNVTNIPSHSPLNDRRPRPTRPIPPQPSPSLFCSYRRSRRICRWTRPTLRPLLRRQKFLRFLRPTKIRFFRHFVFFFSLWSKRPNSVALLPNLLYSSYFSSHISAKVNKEWKKSVRTDRQKSRCERERERENWNRQKKEMIFVVWKNVQFVTFLVTVKLYLVYKVHYE